MEATVSADEAGEEHFLIKMQLEQGRAVQWELEKGPAGARCNVFFVQIMMLSTSKHLFLEPIQQFVSGKLLPCN